MEDRTPHCSSSLVLNEQTTHNEGINNPHLLETTVNQENQESYHFPKYGKSGNESDLLIFFY